jgi:60Kd inner membrane protein
MSVIYHAISSILLFWHSAWYTLVGEAGALGTDWAWILGIVFLVLTVRLALLPVFLRQVRSQRATQTLQPQIKALQDKYKGDRTALQTELVALYRTSKVNPLAGFLPMLVQIPVFLGLLHVLRHRGHRLLGDAEPVRSRAAGLDSAQISATGAGRAAHADRFQCRSGRCPGGARHPRPPASAWLGVPVERHFAGWTVPTRRSSEPPQRVTPISGRPKRRLFRVGRPRVSR